MKEFFKLEIERENVCGFRVFGLFMVKKIDPFQWWESETKVGKNIC